MINSTKSVVKSRNQTIRCIKKYIDQHIDEYNNFFTFKKRKIRGLITQSLQNGFLGFTHHGVLTSGEMGVSGLVGFKEVGFSEIALDDLIKLAETLSEKKS